MKIENGKIIIDVYNYVRSLTREEKLELIDYLSCENDVIKNVSDQILDGFTELMSNGPSSYISLSCPYYSIDYARREIAKRSGEIYKKEIENLEKA